MHIDGACHCGEITFEAEIDPDMVVICHCSDCQTMSSTAFRTIVAAPPESFRLVSGTPKTYVKISESGNRRAMAFCPECGTQLWGCNAGDDPGRIGIRVGAVKQRDALVPKHQIWYRSAQGWLAELVNLPRTETQS